MHVRETNAAELITLLRNRHSTQEYAFFEQVRSTTGAGAGRVIDALVMSLWPHRGLNLHGFEIKVSRSDLIKELNDPGKSEAWVPYLDCFWLVCPHHILTGLEIPEFWGVMCPTKVRADDPVVLRMEREARPMNPLPLDRAHLASILRLVAKEVADWVPRAELNTIVSQKMAAYEVGAEQRLQAQLERATAETRIAAHKLEQRIRWFESASGIAIDDPMAPPTQLGELVKAALSGQLEARILKAQNVREALAGALLNLDAALAKLKAVDAIDTAQSLLRELCDTARERSMCFACEAIGGHAPECPIKRAEPLIAKMSPHAT